MSDEWQNNMIIATIIGSLGAIIGGMIGALLTYCLESSRRKREDSEKLLKYIYFKIYTEIEHCFLTKNNFNKDAYIGLIKGISVIEIKNHIENLLENNFDLIDSRLFYIYHIIKSNNYFDDYTGGIENYKYLELFANLSLWMKEAMKKSRMSDKKIIKKLDCLYYEYSIFIVVRKFSSQYLINIFGRGVISACCV